MKALVLSDTHLPARGPDLPAVVYRALAALRPGDVILHAGDLTSADVLTALEAFAPVHAVRGNVDDPEVWALLPEKRVAALGPFRVGLVHGHAGPGRDTPDRAFRAFAGRDRLPDAVVFGHSHQPHREERAGCLLFNPGSPTDRRRAPRCSFGWLWPEGDRLRAEHVFFDRPDEAPFIPADR
ncbi:MAG: metallophosphoesterase [Firmicutes bacterium]|nr:metallophosphoesterase [Bacillota bacterium]